MNWAPHVTVAAVIERDGLFLMVEEEVDEGLVLNQPAGHLEAGETLLEAVVRETREETAWQLDPKGLVGIYRWTVPRNGHTYLRFCFWGEVEDHDPDQTLDEGIQQTLWLSRNDLLAQNRNRSPLVMHAVDDYLSGRRFGLELLNDLP